MACTVMDYTVVAYIVTARKVRAHTVMVYIVMAHVVMASYGYGPAQLRGVHLHRRHGLRPRQLVGINFVRVRPECRFFLKRKRRRTPRGLRRVRGRPIGQRRGCTTPTQARVFLKKNPTLGAIRVALGNLQALLTIELMPYGAHGYRP